MKTKYHKKTSLKNLTLYLFFVSYFCFANDSIEISILTCAPGSKTYSVFGHSAIRVIDYENAIDTVYNFGIFDFDTPNFTLKFTSGELQYRLGKQQTQNFINEYTLENRTVTEQQLHLNTPQKKILLERLQFLYKPENRYYIYSFLKRNCATEIRDLLISSGVIFRKQQLDSSNRNLINTHLKEHLWFQFGTNLLLGKSLDTKTDTYQSMFLPQLLHNEIENATINDKNLLATKQLLNTTDTKKKAITQNWLSPSVVFLFICIVLLFWFPKPVIFIITALTGIVGFFILITWMYSGHTEVKFNMNILWCNPLYLAYIPILIKKSYNKTISYILILCLLSAAIIWLWGIQSFDIAVAPIFIILGVLNWRLYQLKHKIT